MAGALRLPALHTRILHCRAGKRSAPAITPFPRPIKKAPAGGGFFGITTLIFYARISGNPALPRK
ncbi:hypothetical protein EHJ09_01815 [Cronobacter turicensis]|nr:hypothetical protein [Cronobacter turicensis]